MKRKRARDGERKTIPLGGEITSLTRFRRFPGQAAGVVTRSTPRATSKMSTHVSASTRNEEEQIRCIWSLGITCECSIDFFPLSAHIAAPWYRVRVIDASARGKEPRDKTKDIDDLLNNTFQQLSTSCSSLVSFLSIRDARTSYTSQYVPPDARLISFQSYFKYFFQTLRDKLHTVDRNVLNLENVKGRQIPVAVRARR